MRHHFDFIVAAANLRPEMYGITENRTTDEQYIRTHLTNVIVPDFITADNIKIAANEEEATMATTKWTKFGIAYRDLLARC
jgi:ubiquitin-activating enzyme E1